MNLFDRIKDALYVTPTEDNPQTKDVDNEASSGAQNQPASINIAGGLWTPTSLTSSDSVGQANVLVGMPTNVDLINKWAAHLNQVYTDANLEGQDFLELQRLIQSNIAMGIPVVNAYAAAFNGFKTILVGKTDADIEDILTKSFKHYQTILKAEYDRLLSDSEIAKKEQVDSLLLEAESLRTRNQEAQNQIIALQQEIADNSQKINDLTSEANVNLQKHAQALNALSSAHQTILMQNQNVYDSIPKSPTV
jgi:hypothetical protein